MWEDVDGIPCIHTIIDGGMSMRRFMDGANMVMRLEFCQGMERVEMIRTLKRIH